jgi:hypothetical protein
MRSGAWIVISMIGITLAGPAGASVIFTTGGSPITFSADPANAYIISQDPTTPTFTAVAESFTPASKLNIGEIDLAVENFSGTNELMVLIESGASRPTTVLESFDTTAPATPSLLSIIMSVQHPQLKKGTKYWLVLTDTGDAVDYWFVDPNAARGTSLQVSGSSAWMSSSGSTKGSADVLSQAPEPSSAGLISIGAALAV